MNPCVTRESRNTPVTRLASTSAVVLQTPFSVVPARIFVSEAAPAGKAFCRVPGEERDTTVNSFNKKKILQTSCSEQNKIINTMSRRAISTQPHFKTLNYLSPLSPLSLSPFWPKWLI